MYKLHEKLNLGDFLADTHVHLNSSSYEEDIESVMRSAKENGIEQIFDVAVDLQSSKKSIEISKKYPEVKSFVGIDPEVFIPGSEMFVGFEIDESWFSNSESELIKLIEENRENIVGIGETGMDFYWLNNNEVSDEDKNTSIELQKRLFQMHCRLAKKFELPLTIHSRAAEKECLEIVIEEEVQGIFHSYTGDLDIARAILKNGSGLGVNGIVTFKNAKEIQSMYIELLKDGFKTPGDLYSMGIFIETDGPYLAPDPHRGERNEPKFIKDIYNKILLLAEKKSN